MDGNHEVPAPHQSLVYLKPGFELVGRIILPRPEITRFVSLDEIENDHAHISRNQQGVNHPESFGRAENRIADEQAPRPGGLLRNDLHQGIA